MNASAGQAPVVIIGMGPTGETAANLLGHYGIPVILLEKESSLYPLPRAGALDGEALRVWQSIGILDAILESCTLQQPVEFLDAHLQNLLTVRPQQYPYTFETLVFFHQPTLSQILRAHLKCYPSITVRESTEWIDFQETEEGVEVIIFDHSRGQTETLKASWILACDGANSSVRKRLAIPFRGKTYPTRWMVADGDYTEPPFEDKCLFICDPHQPRMQTHLAQNHYRWEWQGPSEAQPNLSGDPFQLLSQTLPLHFRKAEYRFHHRIANSWFQNRFFLLGDAAHVCPPFLGQGVSNGIRDAVNLCWKLAMVSRYPAESFLLETYEVERRAEVLRIHRQSVLLKNIVLLSNPVLAFLRNLVMRWIQKIDPIFLFIKENQWIYPQKRSKGFLQKRDWIRIFFPNKRGVCLPQFPVMTDEGSVVPFDSVLGIDFTLLEWDPLGKALFFDYEWPLSLPSERSKVIRLSPLMVLAKTSERSKNYWIDTTGKWEKWLGKKPRVLLIRPDRYVWGELPIR